MTRGGVPHDSAASRVLLTKKRRPESRLERGVSRCCLSRYGQKSSDGRPWASQSSRTSFDPIDVNRVAGDIAAALRAGCQRANRSRGRVVGFSSGRRSTLGTRAFISGVTTAERDRRSEKGRNADTSERVGHRGNEAHIFRTRASPISAARARFWRSPQTTVGAIPARRRAPPSSRAAEPRRAA